MNKIESALRRTTDTRALAFGVGTLPRAAELFVELFPGRRALVVADLNTWRVAGEEVHRILGEAGIGQDEPCVFADPGSTPNGATSNGSTRCSPEPTPCRWPWGRG